MIYGEYFNPYNLHCNVLFSEQWLSNVLFSEQLLSKEHIKKKTSREFFCCFM